jgi:hypothetical protein
MIVYRTRHTGFILVRTSFETKGLQKVDDIGQPQAQSLPATRIWSSRSTTLYDDDLPSAYLETEIDLIVVTMKDIGLLSQQMVDKDLRCQKDYSFRQTNTLKDIQLTARFALKNGSITGNKNSQLDQAVDASSTTWTFPGRPQRDLLDATPTTTTCTAQYWSPQAYSLPMIFGSSCQGS